VTPRGRRSPHTPRPKRTSGATARSRNPTTTGNGARLADVDRWTLRDILGEHSAEPHFGLVDEDDAAHKVDAARELEFGDEDSSDEEIYIV
jgi:hypothetical protein